MQQSTIYLIGGGVVVLFGVLAFVVGNLIRDLATHAFNAKRSIDHLWVEFAPVVGKGFSQIIKVEDMKTGTFKYKGRLYAAGPERWQADYPPGRSSLAQVTFYKCLADPASTDMLTNLTGKPSMDAVLFFAVANQKDTTTAMERSQEESGSGAAANKKWTWMYVGLAVVGAVAIAGLIYTIKGQSINEDILRTLEGFRPVFEKIAAGFGQ